MKFSRLILLMSVPFLAAMGDRPERGQQKSDFVRTSPPGETREADPVSGPATAAALEILDAAEADPATFLWKSRPVVIFADSPQDPAFVEQLRWIERDPAQLMLRDVVVILDTDPAGNSAWRRNLRPEGFSLVLLDKDGQVKQRKPAPWSVREIWRAIDKFPLRRQEIGRAGLAP